jgi:tetratricopeptide (TPR) repeat protein
VAEGIALLQHALGAIEAMGFGAFKPPFLLYLGEAYVRGERLDDALESATRALSFTRERGQRGHEAWALRLLGEIAAHRDSPDAAAAEAHYDAALALASDLGMRPLVAHCHLGLGKLRHRAGDRAKAEQRLATATAMYREMDMSFWLDEAKDPRPLPWKSP